MHADVSGELRVERRRQQRPLLDGDDRTVGFGAADAGEHDNVGLDVFDPRGSDEHRPHGWWTDTRDVEVGRETIRAGDPVLMLWASANRDSAEFGPDADEFRVERDPNHHLAFGFGPHRPFNPVGVISKAGRCVEVPVSYRKRVGVSKVTGTLSGTVKASYKILWTIARFALRPPPVPLPERPHGRWGART